MLLVTQSCHWNVPFTSRSLAFEDAYGQHEKVAQSEDIIIGHAKKDVTFSRYKKDKP